MSCKGNALAAVAGGSFVAVMCALLYRRQLASQLSCVREEIKKSLKEKAPTVKSMAGKVVVVTGASSGIGKAIASAFHKQGALVAIGARRLERLEELSKESGDSTRMLPVQTDVTNAKSVNELVKQAEEHYKKGVDVLVNVAGVMYFTLMKNCKTEEWNRTVDVNCKGVSNNFSGTSLIHLKYSNFFF
jgi:NADPH:quinone reductase-like Zn-dependent oxidoreductase